jgi:tetratricopeptide (TPR) repeat protein
MKRTISLWLGLLAFALLPALAQTPAAPTGPTGKIHGHVTNPTGVSASSGSVSLSTDTSKPAKYTFPLTANGDYSGEVAPGTYVVLYRQPDTPPDKMVDSFDSVKIVVGQDTTQDFDMTRKDFIDKLTPDQKKSLEEIKQHNAVAMKTNEIIKGINADLRLATQDIKDADAARATATQTLGATASKADIDAKEAEIRAAKFGEVETVMLKDTAAKPDASILWVELGQAQSGLKKYDDAEASFKKALDLETASKKPSPQTQALADAGLGEIYARAGKVTEANASYAAAAKTDPTQANLFFKNESVIFSNVGNADAQIAAANEAIAADPNQPVPYYLKGQGLIQKATFDAKTHKIVLPEGCAEAYQKYLALAPTGPYAADVKGILDQAGQAISTTYKADKPAKSK